MKQLIVRVGDVARVAGRAVGELQALAKITASMYQRRDLTENGRRRTFLVPDEDLMEIQRRIYLQLLRPIPVNNCVHSAPKRSILTNARVHVRHPYLSVFDIAECFPSISPYRVRAALKRVGFQEDAAWLVTRLTTVNNELPQGAPTSPALLNIVFIDLDEKLASMARTMGLVFTRYYDDLCLSGSSRTPRLAHVVENVLRAHRLTIKVSKRHDWGPTEPHTVTKIMVNTSPSPLPEYVASVQSIITDHRGGTKFLDAGELASLRGKVAYVASVNPVAGRALAELLG